MADEYIRKQDAVDACGKEYPPNTDFERGMICQMVGDKVRIERLQPADVVSVSAYKQVTLERDTVVEQLKQIGKDIREVMDDIVHLQGLLSADIVEIVRCKNCQYHSYDEVFCCYWCEHEGMVREVKPDFYCGYGEE